MSPELSGFLLQAVEFETSVHASGSQELSMFTESHAGHQTRVIYKRHGKETNKKNRLRTFLLRNTHGISLNASLLNKTRLTREVEHFRPLLADVNSDV